MGLKLANRQDSILIDCESLIQSTLHVNVWMQQNSGWFHESLITQWEFQSFA
jgi:hypothetical protein